MAVVMVMMMVVVVVGRAVYSPPLGLGTESGERSCWRQAGVTLGVRESERRFIQELVNTHSSDTYTERKGECSNKRGRPVARHLHTGPGFARVTGFARREQSCFKTICSSEYFSGGLSSRWTNARHGQTAKRKL
ncbi:unnamed protein product [Pleuronectes platessa]|uniref:Secreted protein n=1 Tax=Pleuronectes platessa TaxID=8262 RepID=A0A9N7VR00_PLEPL|nr:unnamed protein product [Pleuronectes platessa]